MKKKLTTADFIRKRASGSPEEGEVDIAEQMTVGTIPEGMREPGKAEEAFRSLVEAGQGFLGLEPGRRGTEAYRTGQALSNLPVLALPAAAVKGTGKVAKEATDFIKNAEGNPLVVYRGLMLGEGTPSEVLKGKSREGYASFGSSSPYVAASYGTPGAEEAEYLAGTITPLLIKASKVVEFPVTTNKYGSRRFDKFEFDRRAQSLKPGEVLVARDVVDIGPRASMDIDPEKLYSYGSDVYAWGPGTKTVSAITKKAQGGEVSTTDFIRKRQAGSPPEAEVPTDDYIQQMMTGTPPSDTSTNPGLLPPELRRAIDVPLDLANMAVRGTIGAVAGPAYGLYKGITSEKFGTPEGVREAGSEAGKMMQRITGVPKTETGRDVMEFIGKQAEALKLAPTPQLLTAPAPGPGSANALLRSYELAETAPAGSVKLPGKEGRPVATPQMDAMGLYSPTEQVVMNLPQEKGTAQQMLAQISKAPGSRAAELRATGLEEYLKGKGNAPVTRQEIQDFLKSNPVQVNEVVLGKGMVLSPEAKRRMAEAENRMIEIDNELINAPYFKNVSTDDNVGDTLASLRGPLARKAAAGDAEAMAEIDALNLPPDIKQLVLEFGEQKNEYGKYSKQARKMVKPQFDNYNIPGGKNAREIYLTLPEKTRPLTLEEVNARRADVSLFYPQLTQSEYDSLLQAGEIRQVGQGNANYMPPSVHRVSPEADTNRLAHIFLDDRMDAEGKKVLFVQELQSDWGQEGKKKGFYDQAPPDRRSNPEYVALDNRGIDLLNEFNRNNNRPEVQERIRPELEEVRRQLYVLDRQYNEEYEKVKGKLPTAPFVTNTEDWLNLALKRVIKEAVDTGADNVAFIKGAQAADKYNLRTVVDQITADRGITSGDDLYVSITPKNSLSPYAFYVGPDGVIKEPISPDARSKFLGEPLSSVIGKEAAEKLMSTKVGNSQILKEEGLSFGGEGMKGFYDNILPKTAEKLLKRLGGGKIETIDLGRTKSRETWVQGREHPFMVEQDSSEPFEGRVKVVNKETGESRMFDTRDEADEYMAEALGHNVDQIHLGFKITPEMREMVKTQGLPKFAAGGEVTQFIKAHA